MADVVNIELLVPSPIVFVVGDQELRCSALVSAADGFDLRRKMLNMTEAIEANEPDAFEQAATELHDRLLVLFQVEHPDLESLPFQLDQLLQVGSKIWQRCLGANDEALRDMSFGDDEEEAPPTKEPQNRSTRRRGSAATSKPSGARRSSGSTSR
jgi:hypothetical protein